MYLIRYDCECSACGRLAPALTSDGSPGLPPGWIAVPLVRGVGIPSTEGHACCEACAVRLLLAPRSAALSDALPAILAAVAALPQESRHA